MIVRQVEPHPNTVGIGVPSNAGLLLPVRPLSLRDMRGPPSAPPMSNTKAPRPFRRVHELEDGSAEQHGRENEPAMEML